MNDAPYEISPIGDQANNEGQTLVISNWKNNIGDVENDPISLVDILNLSGATYLEVGNDLHLSTTDPDFFGEINNIIIRASDGQENVDMTPFKWTISNVNDAPTFIGPAIGNDSFNEDNDYVIDANPLFNDIDTPGLTYTLLNLGVNASYGVSSGIITITPNQDWNGSLSGLQVRANDGEFNVESNAFNLTVDPINDTPVFDGPSISNDNFSEDNDYVIDAKPLFSDVEDITLNYNLLNLGANANYGISNGIITITPNQDWNGNLTGLVIEAEDSGNLKAQSNAFQLTVNPINDAPVFDGPDYGNQSTQKETTFSIPLTRFSDVDNVIEDFSVSFTGLTDASYVINGNNVEITPDNGYVGTMSNVQMTVSDLEPLSDVSDIFDIAVTPPPMTTVDFTFKAAYYDTIMVNGTHTLYWNKVVNPWASDSSRVAVNGVVANVEMEQGLEYEV